MDDTTEAHARQVADALLAGIRETPLLKARPITASIGLAPQVDERTTSAWLAKADEALYRATRERRKRVVSRAEKLGNGEATSPAVARQATAAVQT